MDYTKYINRTPLFVRDNFLGMSELLRNTNVVIDDDTKDFGVVHEIEIEPDYVPTAATVIDPATLKLCSANEYTLNCFENGRIQMKLTNRVGDALEFNSCIDSMFPGYTDPEAEQRSMGAELARRATKLGRIIELKSSIAVLANLMQEGTPLTAADISDGDKLYGVIAKWDQDLDAINASVNWSGPQTLTGSETQYTTLNKDTGTMPARVVELSPVMFTRLLESKKWTNNTAMTQAALNDIYTSQEVMIGYTVVRRNMSIERYLGVSVLMQYAPLNLAMFNCKSKGVNYDAGVVTKGENKITKADYVSGQAWSGQKLVMAAALAYVPAAGGLTAAVTGSQSTKTTTVAG